MVVNWKSEDHLKLANIYMNAEDNISCYDGCKEMAIDHFENDYEDAIQTIKKEKNKKEKECIIEKE